MLSTIDRWKGRKKWTLKEWQTAQEETSKRYPNQPYEKMAADLRSQGFVHDAGDFEFCGLRLNAAYFCFGGHESMSLFYKDEDCAFNPNTIEEGVLTLEEWFEQNAVKQKPA